MHNTFDCMPKKRPKRAQIAFCIAFLLIILLGVLFRLHNIKNFGFFEYDIYFYFGVAQHTLANHLIIPTPLPHSGFPIKNDFSEKPGLIYILLSAYLVAKLFLPTITLYTIVRLIPLLFGIFGMLEAYILAYSMTKDRNISILSMLIMAILPAAVIRTQATEYRGETYAPIILGAIFISILGYQKAKSVFSYKFLLSLIFGAVLLFIALVSWIGSYYILAVFGFLTIIAISFKITSSKLRAVLITLFSGIALWLLGWLLLPHLLPSYYNYLQTNKYMFESIIETQPVSISSIQMYLNSTVLLAPFGILLYIFRKRTNFGDLTFMMLFANLLVVALLLSAQVRWITLIALPISVFSAYFISETLGVSSASYKRIGIKYRNIARAVAVIIILSIIISSAGTQLSQTASGIIPNGFQSAISWVRSNTPTNSTFLTEWQEGSVIESLANRTVYVDSVDKGQNATEIYNLSRFIFAKGYNFTYLRAVRPNYLLLRYAWYNESHGLEIEGNLTNVSINSTNMHLLLNNTNSSIENAGVVLDKVFSNNDTVIYKVGYQNSSSDG